MTNVETDANYGLLDDETGVVRQRHRVWTDSDGETHGGNSVYVQSGDAIIGKLSIRLNKDGEEDISGLFSSYQKRRRRLY